MISQLKPKRRLFWKPAACGSANSVGSWITEASKSEPARISEVPRETSETLLLKEGHQFHQNIYLGMSAPNEARSYHVLWINSMDRVIGLPNDFPYEGF